LFYGLNLFINFFKAGTILSKHQAPKEKGDLCFVEKSPAYSTSVALSFTYTSKLLKKVETIIIPIGGKCLPLLKNDFVTSFS
jgi:hypothetical protein